MRKQELISQTNKVGYEEHQTGTASGEDGKLDMT